MLPTKLRFIWLSNFRGEDLIRNQPIRNKNCLWWSCLLTNQKEMSKFNRSFLSSFASFGQVGSEEEIKKNQPIRNKNCLWLPCLLMDRDKMCKPYRGPSIDASYQVTVHLAKWFQRRLFRNQPIRNKNCLWRPCLLTNRNEMSKLYRGHSIDASYQVSVHLAWRFQRRRFF